MRLDPAIAALQRDRAPQRRAQAATAAACDSWRATPEARAVLTQFARYGEGAPLLSCPALLALFTDRESAPGLAATLVRELCRALAAEPLGHPPFRHGYQGGNATLLLARASRAQLVLHAAEPGERDFAVAAFSDGERREAVLAGQARARIVRRHGRFGRLAEQRLALAPGHRFALDLREEALQLLAVGRRLVSLRLQRAARNPEPSREYDLATGALLRQAAGQIRASRHEAALAVLGRMRRVEAAPVLAAIAREAGDASLRWQALRECLALDSALGFAALGDLAADAGDLLATPARALRAELMGTHPALRTLDAAACLA
jgi:hypothetical protein